jgi:hypothetical protein
MDAESFITGRSSFIQGFFQNEGQRGSGHNGQQGWLAQLEGQNPQAGDGYGQSGQQAYRCQLGSKVSETTQHTREKKHSGNIDKVEVISLLN